MASDPSSDPDQVERAARWLIERRRAPFEPLPAELRQEDAGFAYAVQQAYQRLLAPRFGALASAGCDGCSCRGCSVSPD